MPESSKPSVLFVCVHNAGRSQMAAAYLQHMSAGQVEVRSAGTQPADELNPVVVQAMDDAGMDLSAERPKVLRAEAVEESDVVITMGCGDECPYFPGKRYYDWDLEDPAGKDLEAVHRIREDIKGRVQNLMIELFPALHPDAG
ncbi:arsenate reductase ArsC [Arthrobacter castelli]|uniref:arsenate reductase ArsC n=1 Tax=Arthrobacter castelli TaxID=271431 RepID=UPI00047C4534|nr:arsenate reductase ArsC [Arthrobacter castelli]